jgi:hypothetical protein
VVKDSPTVKTMLMSTLVHGRKTYCEIAELSRPALFFPFEYEVPLEWLFNSPELVVGSFGGKTVVSLGEGA